MFVLRCFVRCLLVRLAPLGSSALPPRLIIWDYTSFELTISIRKNKNINDNVEIRYNYYG